MERCLSCQYYDRNPKSDAAKAANAGQCRKSAPMLSPLNQKSYMIEGVWPTVRDDDWCGEWKAQQSRRVDAARISDVLQAPMPSAMPASATPAGASLPGNGLPPAPPQRVSVQAARAALASFGIESRPGSVTPLTHLTGTSND